MSIYVKKKEYTSGGGKKNPKILIHPHSTHIKIRTRFTQTPTTMK